MADSEIPSREGSIKTHIAIAPSPFEQFAIDHQYDITPAVAPAADRVYADRQTQDAYEVWLDGARYVALMITESTLETEALREKIRELAGQK